MLFTLKQSSILLTDLRRCVVSEDSVCTVFLPCNYVLCVVRERERETERDRERQRESPERGREPEYN